MRSLAVLVVVAACAVSACGRDEPAAPTGQVIATIDGREITAAELRAELGGLSGGNPAAQKQLEAAALQSIVNRKILAGAARAQELDKSPEAAIAKGKAEDLALVSVLQDRLGAGVTTPSREEAERFVAENPGLFAQRRVFVVDQMIASNTPPAVVEAMRPLKSMEEIAALLDRNNIRYNTTIGVIDALGVDPSVTQQIAALPAGEVFVTPDVSGVRVNRVRSTEVRPVTGAAAQALALQILRERRSSEQVRQQVDNLLRTGMAKVRYNDAYKPVAAPAAAPAKAGS